ILNAGGKGLAEVRACLEASRPLAACRLLVIRNQAEEPMTVRSLRLDDRIASFLLGGDAIDGKLHDIVTQAESLEWAGLTAEPQHVERLRQLAKWWQRPQAQGGAAVFLRGAYGSGRLRSARALATAIGSPLLVVDVERALRSSLGWEQIVFFAFREALL